jgi:uncharacterized membrane protein YhaH (DUF805 family)
LGCPLFVTISGRFAAIMSIASTGTTRAGGGQVNARTAARAGWSLFAVSVLLLVPALVLNLRHPQYADLNFTTGELLGELVFVLFAWFGALIVSRRPSHPIGWLLCAFGLANGLAAFAAEYAIYGLVSHPGTAPGAGALAWVTSWLFAVDLALLTALLLLFPSGRPPSPRWWWVLWLASVGNGLIVIGALGLWPLRGVALLQTDGPEQGGLLAALGSVGFLAALAALLVAGASLVVCFRRARGVERQQLKWLLYAVVIAILGIPLLSLAPSRTPELAADLASILLIALIPVAVGLAILRYRLYDIDRLINRTLVYGLLTALLAGVYALVVLVPGQLFGGFGTNPPSWAIAGATLAVAALFRPARRRIQQGVDRRFNRRKYDAAKTIEAFSARLREQIDLDTLSTELLAVADQTMQPMTASLWLRPATQARSRGR